MSGMKDSGVIDTVRDSEKQKLQPPRKYKVVLNNDDYTPMDFVIEVLTTFFNMDSDRATDVMLQVHEKGKGICGVNSAGIESVINALPTASKTRRGTGLTKGCFSKTVP